jgi:cytochrome c2
MAGMPSFLLGRTPEELWAIVAFVRQMNRLSPEEYRGLVGAAAAPDDTAGVRWVGETRAEALGRVDGDPARGKELLRELGCRSCHVIPGVKGPGGDAGPSLARWAERQFISGRLVNKPAELTAWILNPAAIDTGTAMPAVGATVEQALDMAAYLYTLGARPMPARGVPGFRKALEAPTRTTAAPTSAISHACCCGSTPGASSSTPRASCRCSRSCASATRSWSSRSTRRSPSGAPTARSASSSEPELERTLHKTIRKVEEDTLGLAMNTAISQMMVFVNEATQAATLPLETATTFVRVLAPYAPHLAEELWERLGQEGLVAHAAWPAWDPALTVDDTITIVVQVNGKKRDELVVAKDTDRATLERLALAAENAQRFLEGRTPRKVIVVPGRLVNLVV